MSGPGTRLDRALVDRGLARSRGHARELVESGRVIVAGAPARRVSMTVSEDASVELIGEGPSWVGRAAGKLAGALSDLGDTGPPIAGRRCIDLGASTGGFTQVLLEAGAEHVVALDVGHDQLVPELRADPRVTDRSGTTLRGLQPQDVGAPFGVVVADLSFISLRLVLPEVRALLADDGDGLLLVKPQFEVGRARLGRRGVVTDPAARRDAVLAVLDDLRGLDLNTLAILPSRVRGAEGNHEYVLWITRRPVVGPTWQAQQRQVAELVAEEDP